MPLKIGAVAERGGVNPQTIRYYERQGLLPAPPRLQSGYRMFPDSTVRRVRFIKSAQELGFSLAEIGELLAIQIDPVGECAAVQRMARAKVSNIDGRIATLKRMRSVLSRLANECPGRGTAQECPILETIDDAEAQA